MKFEFPQLEETELKPAVQRDCLVSADTGWPIVGCLSRRRRRRNESGAGGNDNGANDDKKNSHLIGRQINCSAGRQAAAQRAGRFLRKEISLPARARASPKFLVGRARR